MTFSASESLAAKSSGTKVSLVMMQLAEICLSMVGQERFTRLDPPASTRSRDGFLGGRMFSEAVVRARNISKHTERQLKQPARQNKPTFLLLSSFFCCLCLFPFFEFMICTAACPHLESSQQSGLKCKHEAWQSSFAGVAVCHFLFYMLKSVSQQLFNLPTHLSCCQDDSPKGLE
jgi:hypothetical protein